jgi:hypothetical protein
MYKNWEAIDQIPDLSIKMGIANMDITTEYGQYFMSCLPEYFCKKRNDGPVPLSVIRKMAILLSRQASGYKMPVSHGVFKELGIPVLDCHFHTEDENRRAMASLVHRKVDEGLKIGGQVESGDNHYVLVQIGFEGNNTHFHLVAADRIVVD